MDHFRTQYEKLYEGESYYWGTEPADFLEKLIALKLPGPEIKVLDIGCGEGKDAVYMAQQGYSVMAFDLTASGIRKTMRLAEERGVKTLHAYVDDINDFETAETFDIIYSTGTIQYLKEENIAGFFEKVRRLTNPNGLNYFNVFVEKAFLELPPDLRGPAQEGHDACAPFCCAVVLGKDSLRFELLARSRRNLHCGCIAQATPEQRRFVFDFADRMLAEELIRA